MNFTGEGIMTWPDGTSFKGQFKNLKMTVGMLHLSEGLTYSATFSGGDSIINNNRSNVNRVYNVKLVNRSRNTLTGTFCYGVFIPDPSSKIAFKNSVVGVWSSTVPEPSTASLVSATFMPVDSSIPASSLLVGPTDLKTELPPPLTESLFSNEKDRQEKVQNALMAIKSGFENGRISNDEMNSLEEQMQKHILYPEEILHKLTRDEERALQTEALSRFKSVEHNKVEHLKLLECGVCYEPYSDQGDRIPYQLPCGHTYCFESIRGLMRTTRKCPECRRPLPDSGAELAVNYAVLSIVGQYVRYLFLV